MKIAYLINQYPRVSHSFIRREILALERRGFVIQRIALRGWDEVLPDQEDRAEQARTLYVLKDGIIGLLPGLFRALLGSPARFFAALRLAVKMSHGAERGLAHHLAYLAEACRVLTWLNRFGAQRIHAHFGTNSAEVTTLTRILGGPRYSFTVHGPEEFMQPMSLEDKVHLSAFVVAVSSFGRSQLYMRSRHTDWPKIKVVHCGVDSSFLDIESFKPTVAARLVCVGRLCEAKGQLLLVEAVGQLAAKGVAFELVLAGDGPMRGEIEKAITTRGLNAQIHITGWISGSNVREEILAARALVLPTFAEGLPVVIMEAMALRRPVLSTFVAGIPELVKPGENGWLFPAGSVEDLVLAMEDCLAQPPEVLRRMGEAGYSRVIERHSVDSEAAKLAELFNDAAF